MFGFIRYKYTNYHNNNITTGMVDKKENVLFGGMVKGLRFLRGKC